MFFKFAPIFAFMALNFLLLSCAHNHKTPHSKTPVELVHGKEVYPKEYPFTPGKKVKIQLLFQKPDLTNGLYFIPPGKAIPGHFNDYDKAFYIYQGKVGLQVKGKIRTLKKGDSVYVPKSSVTQLINQGNELAKVYFFYPYGPLYRIEHHSSYSKDPPPVDKMGNKIKVVLSKDILWENWDGKIKKGHRITPIAWKTLIENRSMILGITRIDAGYDVDSHYHKPTQVVIFEKGQGKTHISDGKYVPVNVESVIYPPSYSIHHTINTGSETLWEIYFFNQGPFSTIKYHFDKK